MPESLIKLNIYKFFQSHGYIFPMLVQYSSSACVYGWNTNTT